jgi:hypothetical protein
LETISGNMFLGCVSLENITIPTSVHTIGSHAFDGCSQMQ